ncbi:MAG: AbrB family DNA-binding protein [Candidatus Aenigmarchaeota archaeon]|nr:AbrB family DNA-binding protein [Candidatus Aenigmarchaeota archaeon]
MKNFNIIKLDSKGRLLVPFHIREYLSIENGAEFIIVNNERKELKIIPLIKGQTAEIRVYITDVPGSLAKTIDKIAEFGIDILASQSKVIERGELAEYHAIADISNCGNIKKVGNDLSHMKNVKKAEIIEK